MKIFLLESAVAWAVLLLFYEAFLRRQTHFRMNRAWLVFAAVAGLGLPFLRAVVAPFLEAKGLPTVVLPVFDFSQNEVVEAEKTVGPSGGFDFEKGLLVAYFLGLGWGLFRLAVGFLRIKKWIKMGEPRRLDEGLFLIETDEKGMEPSSFFKYVFLSKSLIINDLERAEILAHEQAHVLGGHSREVVFFEFLVAIFWFQPLVWLLRNRLREAHEFEADRAAAHVFSAKQYGQLLLRAATDGLADRNAGRGLTNPFFTSPVKIRILMLLQKKSPPLSRLRYLAALPIVAALLFFQPKKAFAQDFAVKKDFNIEVIDTAVTFDPDTYFESVYLVEHRKKANGQLEQSKFYLKIDTFPEFPGGQTALLNFLATNTKYPSEARKAGAQGKVFVQFIVEKDGSITEIDLAKAASHPTLGVEAMRVIGTMPRWRPGRTSYDKVPERVRMVVPILFKMD